MSKWLLRTQEASETTENSHQASPAQDDIPPTSHLPHSEHFDTHCQHRKDILER